MIEELLDGRTADRILVGVGPGSFTGIRVGIAAAQGLAIGWDAELAGMSSLALLAAGAHGTGPVAAAMHGGHGELFVQQFERDARRRQRRCSTSTPPRPRRPSISRRAGGRPRRRRAGRGARLRAKRSRRGRAPPMRSSCPRQLRTLPPRPIYARAPDARAREAADEHLPSAEAVRLAPGRFDGPRRGDGDHDGGLRAAIRRGVDAVAMRRDPADDRRLADARP